MNWISRWFGGARKQAAAANACAKPAALPSPCASAAAPPSEVDALFYRWLAGAGEHACPASTERLILDELATLAAQPGAGANLVPRVPAVIPQLLGSLRDDSLSGADLARQIERDVVLVAEVIREANSPYYHPGAPVKTVEGAVMLLGQSGLRMLLARVSFRPIINMQGGRFTHLVTARLWSQSEKCAQAASLLAPALRANPFEAYLAGLMHNVGLVVAFRLIEQIYPGLQLPRSGPFCAGLMAQARVISARIAVDWGFPATVAAAIEQQRLPEAPALARVLALSDRLGKLRMLVDAGVLDGADRFVLGGLDEPALAIFAKLHTEED